MKKRAARPRDPYRDMKWTALKASIRADARLLARHFDLAPAELERLAAASMVRAARCYRAIAASLVPGPTPAELRAIAAGAGCRVLERRAEDFAGPPAFPRER